MRVLTISNLFPRPDRRQAGMFNMQLFREMAVRSQLRNVCLVPEWRRWRWGSVRAWTCPKENQFPTRYEPVRYAPVIGRNAAHRFYRSAAANLVADAKGCDVIYSSWLYPDGVLAASLARDLGLPCWLMVLGSDTYHLDVAPRRQAILAACHNARGIVCVARHLGDRLTRHGVDPRKIHVVPNGVDTGQFRFRPRQDVVERLRLASASWGLETRTALFVGNLVPEKGVDLLVAGWTRLVKRVQSPGRYRLYIVGTGTMHEELQARVEASGVAHSVRFVGVRPHEEIPFWLNACDCLCLTSRSEGMPNIVLEALASGTPVMAARVGACEEMLAAEPCARLVDAEDDRKMGDALHDLLHLPVDRQAMAERHRGRTWGTVAEEVLALIRRA